MRLLLGIDVGTSATKALIGDEAGRVVAASSAAHPISHPRPGWSEQDPQDWWASTIAATRAVIARAGCAPDAIAAVGLSGQMHGSVLLPREALNSGGRDAVPLRPALLWNDQRTARQCEQIERAVGGRRALVSLVGNAALTGFTAPKLLWIRDSEPDVWRRTAAVCLPKDFVRLRLTGVLAGDVGDCSGTLLFDPASRAWSERVCAALDIDPALLPPVFESAERTGAVSDWAAQQTGLARGVPVVAGSGDNMTGAVGSGVVERGIVACTLGTSGVIIAHADTPAFDLPSDGSQPAGRTHTMCSGTGSAGVRGAWCITGCMLSAGGSLRWLRDTLFPGATYDELMADAAAAPPGAGGLIFLPYLTGERCPHPDPLARGAFVGLTARHTRAHLVRAVIEGVAMGMGQILGIVRSLGVPVRAVRISGGGARSALWRQVLADCLEAPVVMTNTDEGPAYGATLLAGVGVGVWDTVPAACRAVITQTQTTMPGGPGAEAYALARAVYDRLYHDLKAQFAALASIDA